MKTKPYIIISNDDGINAPGIAHLANIASRYADVLVIAPEVEHSGQSHAVTTKTPLFANFIKDEDNIKYYSCSGTPVDCIKLGLKMFANRLPDLIISGINHGSNAGNNVFYSGTMAIAIEAVFEKIPSIGFSYCSHSHNEDMTHVIPYVDKIIKTVLDQHPIVEWSCWNVNIPHNEKKKINGIQVCRMSKGIWSNFFDERIIPTIKKPYYWLFGDYTDDNPQEGTDEYALQHDFISIVPIKIDLTYYEEINKISTLFR